jgi:hypothetical protein
MDFLMGGTGTALTPGIQGDLRCDFACTITGWALMADQTGSLIVDVWKQALGSYPPTVANSITGASPPTISAGLKGSSTTLTGWTTNVNGGDVFRFNVNSNSAITRCTIALTLVRF